MAALRLFTRSKLSAIILRSSCHEQLLNNSPPIFSQVQKKWATYRASPIYKEPSKYTDFEVTKDPQEWMYVERLLKPKIVPVPPLDPNQNLPSGWKPPSTKPGDYPYYVQRTRNYMQPVYLEISFRGMRRVTIVRRIHGDIWMLESELTEYLEKSLNKKVGVRINELAGELQFRGDYVSPIKRWMDDKGF